MKLLEVEGAYAPVPHSWRRYWLWFPRVCKVVKKIAFHRRPPTWVQYLYVSTCLRDIDLLSLYLQQGG